MKTLSRWGRGKKKWQRISLALFWGVWVPSPNPKASARWSAAWIGASFRSWLYTVMTCDVQLHLVICWINQLKNLTVSPSSCFQVNDSEQKNKLLPVWSTVFGPHSMCSNVAVFSLFLFLFLIPPHPKFLDLINCCCSCFLYSDKSPICNEDM